MTKKLYFDRMVRMKNNEENQVTLEAILQKNYENICGEISLEEPKKAENEVRVSREDKEQLTVEARSNAERYAVSSRLHVLKYYNYLLDTPVVELVVFNTSGKSPIKNISATETGITLLEETANELGSCLNEGQD